VIRQLGTLRAGPTWHCCAPQVLYHDDHARTASSAAAVSVSVAAVGVALARATSLCCLPALLRRIDGPRTYTAGARLRSPRQEQQQQQPERGIAGLVAGWPRTR